MKRYILVICNAFVSGGGLYMHRKYGIYKERIYINFKHRREARSIERMYPESHHRNQPCMVVQDLSPQPNLSLNSAYTIFRFQRRHVWCFTEAILPKGVCSIHLFLPFIAQNLHFPMQATLPDPGQSNTMILMRQQITPQNTLFSQKPNPLLAMSLITTLGIP